MPRTMYTYDDKTLSIQDWAEETGIPYTTLRTRYDRGMRGAKLFAPVGSLAKFPAAEATGVHAKPSPYEAADVDPELLDELCQLAAENGSRLTRDQIHDKLRKRDPFDSKVKRDHSGHWEASDSDIRYEDDEVAQVMIDLAKKRGKDLTLEEIGWKMRMSRERVRQIEVQALKTFLKSARKMGVSAKILEEFTARMELAVHDTEQPDAIEHGACNAHRPAWGEGVVMQDRRDFNCSRLSPAAMQEAANGNAIRAAKSA
jgi:hypothetical protein